MVYAVGDVYKDIDPILLTHHGAHIRMGGVNY
jgi:hypothetical protein